MDIANSVEMPTGKIKDLPPPRTTQEEVRQSGFRKAFEHARRLKSNGLLDVGYFESVDENDARKGRNVV